MKSAPTILRTASTAVTFVRGALVLTVITSLALACGDSTAPADGSGPAIDVVGRVTLPSGAPAAGVTVTGKTEYTFLCDLPASASNEGTISTTSGADGMYRLRIRADTPGMYCVGVFAQSVGDYVWSRRVADVRAREPFVVLRFDLSLR